MLGTVAIDLGVSDAYSQTGSRQWGSNEAVAQDTADIGFSTDGRVGIITLHREAALNALTHDMLSGISAALDEWEADDRIKHIVICAEGRAFSAGGDLLDIYKRGMAGIPNYPFFQDEYRLNARLGIFPKPIIALIDGIVMGGGVGVAVHGRYRVMTENAVFSMPEVSIGFFPDVGGSYFLPRLPDRMGYYLGLTGARIKAGDAYRAGIATHMISADRLTELTNRLAQSDNAHAVLEAFHDEALSDTALDHAEIAELFSAPSLPEVLQSLDKARHESALATKTCKALDRNSPTSIAVAHRQIEHGAQKSLADCMRMEYRILVRMLRGRDFYEGIRSVIVDKTNDPKWQPDTIAGVSQEAVEAYFEPLGEEELVNVPDKP